jgi:hypothetical protein
LSAATAATAEVKIVQNYKDNNNALNNTSSVDPNLLLSGFYTFLVNHKIESKKLEIERLQGDP